MIQGVNAMTFQTLLAEFIGSSVEVEVPGNMIDGTLTAVRTGLVQVAETPVIYSPQVTVSIPTVNIEYVRILVG